MLQADGDSMIDAGIDDGDYVVIKKQSTAEDGQIIAALYSEDTTLKRFQRDVKNKRFILHPENEEYDDIILDEVIVQGICVTVLKQLN